MPTIAGVSIFPANNVWNVPVDGLPVHSNSANLVASICAERNNTGNRLRIDDVFPLNIVHDSTPKVPLNVVEGNAESDLGLYPIPNDVVVESGLGPGRPPNDDSDAHCLLLNVDSHTLYEIGQLRGSVGAWNCYAAAYWDLDSHALRPKGWTSPDAAGLPILPGIARYEDVLSGAVNHCLRMTCTTGGGDGSNGTPAFLWPARHYANREHDNPNPNHPMMGQRFRLKASVNLDTMQVSKKDGGTGPLDPVVKILLRALQKYGAMVADNGQPWGMQRQDHPAWAKEGPLSDVIAFEVHQIQPSTMMEAVDATVLKVNDDLGLAAPMSSFFFMGDRFARATPVSVADVKALLGGGVVVQPVIIVGGFATAGQLGVPYSSGISASGGTPPYTYSVTAGVLPAGLILGTGTGALVGMPTTAGAFAFSVTARDSSGGSIAVPFNVAIAPAVSNSAPVITAHPQSQSVKPPAGQKANVTFTAAATGVQPITQQWQVNPGGSWIPVGTGPSYTTSVSQLSQSFQVRAIFTNSAGAATSNVATLTIQR